MRIRGFLICILAFFITGTRAQVVINELCAHNGSVITDEDGDAESWIELYNTGTTPVSLYNYSLRGDINDALAWQLPNTSIAPQDHLLIFLSGKNRAGATLHTSFTITSKTETIQLLDASGSLVSQVIIPALQLNHSYGRYPDGTAAFKYFDAPTPGATNNLSAAYPGYVQHVTFSAPPGHYTGSKQITLHCNEDNTEIRVTVDGSEPTAASPLYTAPLFFSNSVVLKAKAFKNGKLPSATETSTYFFEDTKLPVISLSTDPSNFFSQDSGIYVLGQNASSAYPYYGANYWQPWERPVHLEYFDEQHNLKLEQDLGVQINGGSSSRTRPMKALRLVPRKKYGDASISYKFFNDKSISSFKSIVLRNASGDFCKLHFRDGFVHSLVLDEHIDVDVLDYKPAVVYINGFYYGIHNIRERVSKDYLQENYNIDPDNVDILEEDTTVIEGDYTAFNAMESFILNNDMSIAANFDSAAALIDIKSLSDYFITETFFVNIDWPYNNLKYWRERTPGSKWRYILLDLDVTMNNNGWAPASSPYLGTILGPFGDNNRHVKLFKALLKNNDYRSYFINRYADLVNTAYSTASLEAHFEKISGAVRDEMPRHMQRWWLTYSDWTNEIDNVAIPYLEQRPQYALDDIQDTFHLNKQVDLSLQVWPPGAGQVILNTITPRLPFSGTYFDGVPVSITAVAAPGYTFQYWRSGSIFSAGNRNSMITFNPDTSDVLTAYFVPSDRSNALVVYPNPSNDAAQAQFVLDEAGEASITITDVQGRLVYSTGTRSCMQGVNFIGIPSEELEKGIYFVHLSSNTAQAVSRFVKQ